MEDVTFSLRELMHRLTDKGDENALREILAIILSSREDSRKLSIIMQLLHDEKTFILSDTEILKHKELDLLKKASLYHVLYEIARAFKEHVDCKFNVDDFKNSIQELNLSDFTEQIKALVKCALEKREDIINILEDIIKEVKLPDKKTPPALGYYLTKFILESLRDVINIMRELT